MGKPIIYLDTCAIQRPLDTPTQIRIVLEADAILGVLRLWELGKVEIVSSVALLYETERTPDTVRQEHARAILGRTKRFIRLSPTTERRAEDFVKQGLKALDALHLALAEEGGVDFFCTCDGRLLRKARSLPALKVKVVSPLELVEELER